MTTKLRVVLICGIVAAVTAAAWFGWRLATTPAPPEVPLGYADKSVVELIEKTTDEVRRQPRSGAAWGKLGMVLASNMFDDYALICFVHAERFDPQEPRWPYLRGLRLLTCTPREALPVLRQALAVAWNAEQRGLIRFRLAQALIEAGELGEAGQHVDMLHRLEPDSARSHFVSGLLAIARDDRAAAREHLETLTENPSARRKAYALLATVADDLKLARDYQRRAAELAPDLPWPDSFTDDMRSFMVNRNARLAQMQDLARAGKLVEAFEVFEQVTKNAANTEACLTLGTALVRAQDWERAEKLFRSAIELDPRCVNAHFYLGVGLLENGERKLQEPAGQAAAVSFFCDALAALDRALAVQSDHARAHLARGKTLKYLNRKDESLAALRRAHELRPESADMCLALGEALAESGKLREGIQLMEEAARLAPPDDPRVKKSLERWRGGSKALP